VTQAPPPAPAPAASLALRALSGVERLARRAGSWLWRDPRRAVSTLAGALALLLVLGWALAGSRSDLASAVVREGPFKVSIAEAGTLQAVRSVTYASTIQSNQAKITALAPEGKPVQKGDLLILFDAAPFEEEIRRNQALLGQAEAELAKAREDLKLQGLSNREELMAAQLRVEKSDLELKDVQQGKGRVKEDETQQAVAAAQRDLQKAETALADLEPLLAEGFITRTELGARRAAGRERARGPAARRAAPRRAHGLRAARSSSARPARTLSRAARRCGSSRARRPTASRRSRPRSPRRTSRIQEAAARLELAKQQLARCEVRAEVPGIVVYKDVFFGSEQRKPQVGDQVWANQPLVILPTSRGWRSRRACARPTCTRSSATRRSSVRVEAYPDLRLTGTVSLVGRSPRRRRSGAAPSSSRCAFSSRRASRGCGPA
jgi:HlyD family secretion protein